VFVVVVVVVVTVVVVVVTVPLLPLLQVRLGAVPGVHHVVPRALGGGDDDGVRIRGVRGAVRGFNGLRLPVGYFHGLGPAHVRGDQVRPQQRAHCQQLGCSG
jgi:hypothetical protein